MLKFFGNGHLSRYVAILFLLVLFWIPAIVNPAAYNSASEPIFIFLSNLIGVNIYFPTILALIIIIFSALLLNQLTTDYEFSARFSSLGLFFFVLFCSAIPLFFSFNPILLANIFILILLKNVFKLPTTAAPISVVFNSGLLIGIASLFFPPLVILLFFLWGAIFMHRLTDWRNFAVSMIGIVLPYLFLFTWYFWTGSVIENSVIMVEEYFFIPDIKLASFSLNYVIIIFLFLIIIVSALNTLSRLREKNINLRRNLMITVLYLSFTLLLSWYYYKIMETMLLVAVPAALLLTNSTFQSKRLKFLNFVIYLLLGLIIINLYVGLAGYIYNN